MQNISALKTITTTVLPPLAQELVSTSALKAERIAWRMARCREFLARDGSNLCPYFETGVDTVEDAAARLTKVAIHMAEMWSGKSEHRKNRSYR